ncbi:Ser/Thr protein phosphatase, putative [Trichomonas vaginalis G3]|uniref:Serine/threonine-protein phosphatase n=1 Tax=Trichomonas vaginalis (strain ATCC PRA-98 / G3) TaxID=412133 RepID=A2GNS2_TRIV3|nr:phosphoprotein phosphatase protein [Trichomonas vaginalis G3]EAX81196.1 Ser/Thr protein phosphatase, putative [Trichomonas vaginalis G3]KAI5505399.1 phosphoprotein phosphatase protein [Trichomonas vaginalis G3]|eukprot:XP_001294126.1 Ser/Thr protein phosphatase [Trichomonas vaginalis G3]
MNFKASKLIYESFSSILELEYNSIINLGKSILIPSFGPDLLNILIEESLECFKGQKPLILFNERAIVVGDIHGNLHDLLRILKINGLPPDTYYIFLGDYVDRGEYSIEVISLLLSLHNLFPEQIFLLRGNHETRETNEVYGFKTDILYTFSNTDLWEQFNNIFDYFPIAAIINDTIFCVHGGLSPQLHYIDEIRELTLPMHDLPPQVNDMLWSDPSDMFDGFSEGDRGIGCIFGQNITQDFLDSNKLKTILRGHQCCSNGVRSSHDGKVITVFSSSNYEMTNNYAAYLRIGSKIHIRTLEKVKRVRKRSANFQSVALPTEEETGDYKLTNIISYIFSFFGNKNNTIEETEVQ